MPKQFSPLRLAAYHIRHATDPDLNRFAIRGLPDGGVGKRLVCCRDPKIEMARRSKYTQSEYTSMQTRNIDLTEYFDRWLGAAVREGIEDIEGTHYTTLRSAREIGDFVAEARQEASPNWRVERGVPKQPRYELRFARAARRDLVAVMRWSLRELCGNAALRYDALLTQAFVDIFR